MKLKLFETQLCMQHIIRSGHAKQDFLVFKKSDSNHINFIDEISGIDVQDKLTRLNVYAHGFILRLVDCLKADLPALVHFFGEDLFNDFARAYIHRNPSTSFTLYNLSQNFHDFIQQSQPDYSGLDEEEKISFELPLALIEFEQARSRALLIRGLESINFYEKNPKKYIINPTLQLLELKFPLIDFYYDLLKNAAHELPPYQQCYLAIYRVNYRLKYLYLTIKQFNFLKNIKDEFCPENDENKLVLIEQLGLKHLTVSI